MRRGPRSTAPFVGSAGADAWERGDGGVENVRGFWFWRGRYRRVGTDGGV